ncbi:MAG: FAD:protein FMN transferase [Planctomycetota bacterium]|jgi:thiamine biosynthesis lipoprotein
MSACRRGLLPFFLLINTISFPCACWAGQGFQRFEYSEIVMGVEARIVLYCPDEAAGRRAARGAFDRLAQLDGVMSDYRPDSELARVCRRAGPGRGPVPVSDDLGRVLDQARAVSAASAGAFDVTVGPLAELWRRARRAGKLPDPSAIDAARTRVGWRSMLVDTQSRTLELTRPDMQLDLGGIGKGFAAGEAVAFLSRCGVSRCLVDLGGDIAAGDPPPGADGWQVAIASKPARVLTIAGQAVAMSGDTEQYLEIDGVRYSHIIDPRSGVGLTDRTAVTVIGPEAAITDALASAISVLGAEHGLALLDQFPGTSAFVETDVGDNLRRVSSDLFTLAAIDATVHGHSARYESGGGKDHIGYWSNPEDTVSWTFELKQPGRFRVSIDYACAPGNGGGVFRMASGPFELRGRIEATGSWTDFRTMELGLIHFEKAGAQEIRVEPVRLGGSALMNLRRVTLQRVDDQDRPNLDRLIADGCYTDQATTTEVTVSGPAWSSFLTGVWPDKHGVHDNTFEGAEYARYPHFFARLKEARPDAFTVSTLDWIPLDQYIVATAGTDVRFVWDYEDGGDEKVADAAVEALTDHDPDIVFVYFADLDVAGHEHGYHPGAPGYVAELEEIDGQVGQLIDAVHRRPTFAGENWLILVSSDHGGTIDGSHGRDEPLHRNIPLIVSGPAAARGRLHTTANVVDIPATALAHLGVAVDPTWGLDGRPVGLAGSTAFGANLIFNGDAEYGGGYDEAARNAGIAGWTDTGAMTVIRYGAPEGFPAIDAPGPARRGSHFFCGGKANVSAVHQVIDVADIATEIDAGLVVYALTGWFGGYSDQRDLASLTARFLDERGGELAAVTIGHVTVEDRGAAFGGEGDQLTGLLPKAVGGRVPPATRRISLRLVAEAGTGDNDGYADNLSLVLQHRR